MQNLTCREAIETAAMLIVSVGFSAELGNCWPFVMVVDDFARF